jgi:hypothetical protein
MGANSFYTEVLDEPDVKAAFAKAGRDSRYEDGHGGYTGKIADKHDYVVITTKVCSSHEASELAEGLLGKQDPRIYDKWGPAGAIPVAADFRHETVQLRRPTSRLSDRLSATDLLELAKPSLRLHRGETLVEVRRVVTTDREITVDATIRLATAGKRSVRELTITLPGYVEKRYQALREAVAAKLAKPGAALEIQNINETATQRTSKVVTERSSGRSTRYIVRGDAAHDSFETGFETLPAARARLAEAVRVDQERQKSGGFYIGRPNGYSVEAVVRAKDGRPFAAAHVATTSEQVTCQVVVVTGRVPVHEASGWGQLGSRAPRRGLHTI